MSEFPPPGAAEDSDHHGASALTPERIDAVLGEFRAWLISLAEQPPAAAPPSSAEPLDWHAVLSQFIALRHEVHLQTKAVRSQQEQNADMLQQLSRALTALQTNSAANAQSESSHDDVARPLLKAMIEIHDALGQARRQVEKAQAGLEQAFQLLADSVATATPRLWIRWFRRRASPRRPDQATANAVAGARDLLESMLTGYTMSLERVERAIASVGLESMATRGEQFDPERMEAIDAIAAVDQPPGMVLEEVRRGYLWRGRVFRFALVRVTR